MRRWVVLSLIAVSGCGDGSKSGGAVDPASLDACLAWSNGVCRLAFLCVDTPDRDAENRRHHLTTGGPQADPPAGNSAASQGGR